MKNHLSDFNEGYTPEKFMLDLINYFGPEVDFDLDKIEEFIRAEDRLKRLIQTAKENNTHPVSEFVKKLFKEVSDDARIKLDIGKKKNENNNRSNHTC